MIRLDDWAGLRADPGELRSGLDDITTLVGPETSFMVIMQVKSRYITIEGDLDG